MTREHQDTTKKARYIPWLDMGTWFVLCLMLTLLYVFSQLDLFTLLSGYAGTYLFALFKSNFITVCNGELWITHLYLIPWTERILLKDIITLELMKPVDETDNDVIEGVYPISRRIYKIQWTSKKGRHRNLSFEIDSNKVESQIIRAILSGTEIRRTRT
jgi:hypothetical protein